MEVLDHIMTEEEWAKIEEDNERRLRQILKEAAEKKEQEKQNQKK